MIVAEDNPSELEQYFKKEGKKSAEQPTHPQ